MFETIDNQRKISFIRSVDILCLETQPVLYNSLNSRTVQYSDGMKFLDLKQVHKMWKFFSTDQGGNNRYIPFSSFQGPPIIIRQPLNKRSSQTSRHEVWDFEYIFIDFQVLWALNFTQVIRFMKSFAIFFQYLKKVYELTQSLLCQQFSVSV